MTTTYHIADIRNVALAGHGASGKTSLADALLFAAGATDRKGSVDDGTSISRRRRRGETPAFHDRLPPRPPRLERQAGPPDRLARLSRLHRQRPQRPGRRRERRRGRLGPVRHRGQHPADLPGGRPAGPGPVHRDHQDGRRERRLPTRPRARSARPSAPQCVPFNVPVGQGPTFSGVVDVLQPHDEDPADCPLPPTEAYQMVVEQIVETDEDLMMRYLEGETIGRRRAAQGRPRRDRRGQARAGALRLHPQGPRRQGAARPDRRPAA